MKRTALVNVVGITRELIGSHTPFLRSWINSGGCRPVRSMLPAVTCSVQATYLTGLEPSRHGIVGNGWYFRDMDEIKFWRQSNRLVQGEKIWERAKKENPDFTCANLFWWYNMNTTVDWLVTPRPIYRADGVKIPDILTEPADLRNQLQNELGRFPLFKFWGPATDISSSDWIAKSAKKVEELYSPDLSLVYLPHLDYNLQRIGPDNPAIATDLQEIDDLCRDLFTWYEERGVGVILVSEYGITPVHQPVSLNQTLRRNGYITVREELGQEILIPGSSRAFAVADHQIAHIYIRNQSDIIPVRDLLEKIPGVETILDEEGKRAHGLDHPRSGELIAISDSDSWFTYYYWLDDSKAPDFAPTVDIHNKPGYDPAELLLDPNITFPTLKAGVRLLQKKLGFRYKMDLVPIDGNQVRGSHGRVLENLDKGPLIASRLLGGEASVPVEPGDVCSIVWSHLTGKSLPTGHD
ncbi:MAG: nucleotide pyrophosphatase/phosphodiesterase family protein [Balneolaceae bacterium]